MSPMKTILLTIGFVALILGVVHVTTGDSTSTESNTNEISAKSNTEGQVTAKKNKMSKSKKKRYALAYDTSDVSKINQLSAMIGLQVAEGNRINKGKSCLNDSLKSLTNNQVIIANNEQEGFLGTCDKTFMLYTTDTNYYVLGTMINEAQANACLYTTVEKTIDSLRDDSLREKCKAPVYIREGAL